MNGDDYKTLKQRLLRDGRLYEDPSFPAHARSLRKDGIVNHGIRWRRPRELVTDPKFIISGATRFDLFQGELGDCWFVAGAATMAVANKRLFARAVPDDQDFDHEYAGIFRFHFWRFDHWTEVIVDDRLPTIQSRLMYAQNRSEPNEFWVPLLEKAYAKIHGCYEYLDGGHTNDALVDLTGGISERIDLTDEAKIPGHFFELLYRTQHMNSMLACSIKTKRIREEALGSGLYRGHAYSVTAMAKAPRQEDGQEVRLLRLRNPWGRGEWNGRWSDHSTEWNRLSREDRDRLRVMRHEGEFWMQYEDWLSEFDEVSMCHLSPDALTEEVAKDLKRTPWREQRHHGEWVRGLSAGGCGNTPHQDLYWTNPQFQVTLKHADDENRDGRCTLVVSLMQKDADLSLDLYISFSLFRLRPGQPVLLDGKNYDKFALRVAARTAPFQNVREQCQRFVLDPGTYVIIPSTFRPHKESEFLLRTFSETTVTSGPIDDPTRDNRDGEDEQKDKIQELFVKHSGGEKIMDAEELIGAVNELFLIESGTKGQFGIESARSLISMVDKNRNGTVDLKEFRKMVKEMKVWIGAFDSYDKDNTGGIETQELKRVFNKIGFSISREALGAIVRRYGGKKRKLSLEDFVHCLSKLVVMYRAFMKHSKDGIEGKAELDLETWLGITLYY